MIIMKRILVILVLFGCLNCSLLAQDNGPVWLTNFAKAKAYAKMSGKTIFANFSGGGWCGFCMLLDKNVLDTPEFKQFAQKNFILLLLDYPRSSVEIKKQSAAIKQQNLELLKKYSIQGYPTILLLNADGKVIARTGYRPMKAKAYIEHLKKLLQQCPTGCQKK